MTFVGAQRLSLRNTWFFVLSALVLLFGGGGAEGGYNNAIIAAVGAFALAAVVSTPRPGAHLRTSEKWWPVILGLGFLAIPLVQLVPLPPTYWRGLSGRESIASTLALVGAAANWRPLSLAPEATLRAATFLLFPLAAFLAAALGRKSIHRNFPYLVAFCAAASALIGAAQLALGHPEWLSFYDGPSFGAASGIFANPNHQALFMAFGLVACGIIIREKSTLRRGSRIHSAYDAATVAAWVGLLFFSLMALASGARAGVMLLIIGLPGSLMIAMGKASVLRWAGLVVGVLALLFVFVLLYPGTNSLGIRESFRLGEDARYAYLPDILYTLDQYWSAGSGLGSFVSVFTPNESLELAGRRYLNHAHNDFLEWALETGTLGVAWLCISVLAVCYLAWRRIKSDGADIGLTMGALLIVTLAGLHSLADYPLRTATVATVFAFAVGLLCARAIDAAPVSDAAEDLGGKPRPKWVVVPTFALAIPIAALALQSHLTQYSIRSGDLPTAAKLNPGNPEVLIWQSEAAIRGMAYPLAESLAARAVILDPLSPAALRQLALSREAQKKDTSGIWQAASALGWRDAPTQLWAFNHALLDGQMDIAAMRGGALLRTEAPDPKFLTLIRTAALNPRFATAVASRVRMNPPWRSTFYAVSPTSTSAEVVGVRQVLGRLARSNEATRADARSLIAFFLAKKQWNEAIRVADLVMPRSDGRVILDDGGFNRTAEDYEKNSTAFDWQPLKGAHVSGNIEINPPSRLVLDSDGEASAAGAQRYLVVNPGNYSMSFDARSDNAESFRVRALCASSSKEVAIRSVDETTRFATQAVDFEIPGGCGIVRLLIEGLPSGAPAMAEFDNFVIEPR